ncbi:MAG: hypothetical protein ABEH65_00995 [Halobacteriales archaeon]
MTVVVATADFEIYHGVVNELRDRGIPFSTVEPSEPLPEETTVVITGRDDEIETTHDIIVADPDDSRHTVEEAVAMLRSDSGRTVIGVDPGIRPGIAVLTGDVVVAAFQVPMADAPATIRTELEGAVDPVVRIGDGARIQGTRLIGALDDVRVELVDETGTTPALGTGARGMGDVLAAVNIARLEGEVVDSRTIEPTAGELQVIKDRSRERSAENRAIDERLARRVAKGDITIEDALDEHRDRKTDANSGEKES